VSASDRDGAPPCERFAVCWHGANSAVKRRGKRPKRFRGMGSTRERGFTMSDLNAVLSPVETAIAVVIDEEETQTAQEEQAQDAEQDDKAESKRLEELLDKAEGAFCEGERALVLSRVECGKWCHAIYVFRKEQGHRGFTSQVIFNRLAVHADNKRQADASELARLYQTVHLLCEPEAWKAMAKRSKQRHPLTIGKLLKLSALISKPDENENYRVFDPAKEQEAKELFQWACGSGMKLPSLEDIANRVLELTDPAAFAGKQAEKAEKAAAKDGDQADKKDADEEDEEETPDTENLISKDADSKPAMPNWKDVPEAWLLSTRKRASKRPAMRATCCAPSPRSWSGRPA
jgi:hypothetical protein